MRGLIIDANGYGPGGELVASGTDGIPWQVQPGAIERFSMSLPLGPQLVREYVVQASLPGLSRPLASAALVGEMRADVGLVRALVLCKPDVPVDAEHRAPDRAGIGHRVRADPAQVPAEIRHEAQHGIPDGGFVAVLVLPEPLPGVVSFQVRQELKQRGGEVWLGRHGV